MSAKPKGAGAVMAQKRPRLSDGQPWQDAELFPTPPWATRALFRHVLPVLNVGEIASIWEPACGLGHMADVLREYAPRVIATDLHDYDEMLAPKTAMLATHDFLSSEPAPLIGGAPEWIITNPPFGLAHLFLDRGLRVAKKGIALLLRTSWIETEGRYNQVFTRNPPSLFAPFAERVAMCEGGWDPQAATATSYAWFVWKRDHRGSWEGPSHNACIKCFIIPPGCKATLTLPSDQHLAARFVPGFVPPSTLKKTGKSQGFLDIDGSA